MLLCEKYVKHPGYQSQADLCLQGFVKSLLDVADNLERAAGSVTDQSLQGLSSDGRPLTSEQSSKLLNGLLEGVHLTDRILVQVMWSLSAIAHKSTLLHSRGLDENLMHAVSNRYAS